MEVYVLKALQKLRGESSRKDVDFRQATDDAMGANFDVLRAQLSGARFSHIRPSHPPPLRRPSFPDFNAPFLLAPTSLSTALIEDGSTKPGRSA